MSRLTIRFVRGYPTEKNRFIVPSGRWGLGLARD